MDNTSMMNVDPNLLSKFIRNPNFAITQSPQTVQTADYRIMSRDWSPNMRITYQEVKAGYSDLDNPPVTVDMTVQQWKAATNSLVKLGALRRTIQLPEE